MIPLSRSSEVKVKVTAGSKLRKRPFSKSISSAIYGPRSGLIMDYESMGQYLKSVGPDFGISVSFSKYWTSKFTQNAVLVRFWLSSNEDYSTMNSRRVKAMVP